MSLDLYKQILNMFPEKPDLMSVKDGMFIPENWPFIMGRTLYASKKVVRFEVSDLNTSIICEVKSVDMISRLPLIEKGQIVFLYDSFVYKNTTSDNFFVDVQMIFTLKEVNDGLPQLFKKKSSRINPSVNLKKWNVNNKNDQTNEIKFDSHWRTLAERWQKQGKIGT